MSVMLRVSVHAASRQLLRQLPLAGLAFLCALGGAAAGCQSNNTDTASAPAIPATPPAQTANAAPVAGAPPQVSSAVQAQIDASRKEQQAAFASHYRATAPEPVKPK